MAKTLGMQVAYLERISKKPPSHAKRCVRRLVLQSVEPGMLAFHSFCLLLVRDIGLRPRPGVGLLLRFILGDAVAFLDAADQLVFLSGHLVPVTVGELAPLFAGLALHLFPVAFNSVPIHRGLFLLH